MNVLCRTELIEKYGEDYALSTVARLIPQKFHHLGDHYWQFLSGFIRNGKRLPQDDELPVTDADFNQNQDSQEWTQTPAAMDAATVLGIGVDRTNLRILEVGCGSAVFGVAISHRDTGSQLTLVDQPHNLARAVTTVEGVGLEERVSYVEADILEPGWHESLAGEEFDLVVIAGVIHRLNVAQCRQLLQEVSNLCSTGTGVALIDVFAGQEKGDCHREIFELELRLRTSAGRIYQLAEVRELMKELEFVDIQFAHLPSSPHIWGLVVATK